MLYVRRAEQSTINSTSVQGQNQITPSVCHCSTSSELKKLLTTWNLVRLMDRNGSRRVKASSGSTLHCIDSLPQKHTNPQRRDTKLNVSKCRIEETLWLDADDQLKQI